MNSSGNVVEGGMVEKLTTPTDIKGRHVAVSEANPEYLVGSDKTDAEAAHKPESLKKWG